MGRLINEQYFDICIHMENTVGSFNVVIKTVGV